MGVSIYVSLEREIADVNLLAVDCRWLNKALEVVDGWAKENSLIPLMEMVSSPPDEIADLMDLEVDDLPEHLAVEQWFPASEGLKTVRAMIEYLQQPPTTIIAPDEVLIDLQDIEAVLVAAEQSQVKFHFSMDF